MHDMRLLLLIITTLLLFAAACSTIPSDVENVLNASASREELDSVIEHYKNLGDKEKLEAAYFLIGNMGNKYSVRWHNRDDYQLVFDCAARGFSNVPMKAKWDSLKKALTVVKEKEKDADFVTSKLLIDNIDLAFDAWRKMPWGRHYNFQQFCE